MSRHALANPGPNLPFEGEWVIIDTVTGGVDASRVWRFPVTITQDGSRIRGRASDFEFVGEVHGSVATARFGLPGQAYVGTFEWTMGADGSATGTFTSPVNRGTSRLVAR